MRAQVGHKIVLDEHPGTTDLDARHPAGARQLTQCFVVDAQEGGCLRKAERLHGVPPKRRRAGGSARQKAACEKQRAKSFNVHLPGRRWNAMNSERASLKPAYKG